ncbi:hypothetical protein NKG05_21565 [Oerskovia sp. M15]
MTSGPRTLRPHLPDVRPLDSFRSLKIKLGVLVFATVTLAVLITWLGQQNKLGPTRTFPSRSCCRSCSPRSWRAA